MLNVTEQTKLAWKNNEAKTVRVVLDGVEIPSDKIYQESMEITESICDDSSLHYIGNISSRLNLKLRQFDTDIIGQIISVYITAGNTEEIQAFYGKVTSANLDETKKTVNLIAYDLMYEICNKNLYDWYSTRVFPMTIKQFRDGLFSFLEIQQETTTLCNDSITIYETLGGNIKGSDILNNLCEINGVFGTMTRDGKFCFKSLGGSVVDVIEPNRTIKLIAEDYSCKPINKLIIRADSDDVGVTTGTGTNTYIVEGNAFAFGMSSEQLQIVSNNLYTQIAGGSYIPTKAEIVGNLLYECGDMIQYENTDGQIINSYILSRKLKGIYALYDELGANGVENYGNALQSNYNELIQLRGQASRLRRTVEGMESEVETIRDDYASKSQLQQTSDSLTAQINYLQQEIDGGGQSYYVDEPPTLTNYPAWDFTYNIPVNNTVQLRDDLQFEYTEEYYNKNLRSLAYDQVNNIAYRFQKVNGVYGWVEVADGDLGIVLQKISRLELTTEGISTEVSELQVQSEGFETKEDAQSTKTYLQSQINQTASEISLKVSKDAVVSEINQSSEQITLNANRLVVNSTNFKLDSTGNVEANNLKLYGGEISVPSGGSGVNTSYFSVTRANGVVFGSQFGYGDISSAANTRINGSGLNVKTNLLGFESETNIGSTGLSVSSKYGGNQGGISVGYTGVSVTGNLYVSGSKLRAVSTRHYGIVGQNAYETCEPYFGDIGESVLDNNGECIVPIEEIFSETISVDCGYQVFLQAYGDGHCYVAERNADRFIVKGKPNMSFAWEIKARQKGYEHDRLKEIKESNNGN